jgi:hypothetical protein
MPEVLHPRIKRMDRNMYQAIGIDRLLTIYALACGVVIVAWANLWPPTMATEWWEIVSKSVSFVAALTWLIGQTPVFPCFCRLPLIRAFFPDIDGRWEGKIESNWSQIRDRVAPPRSAAEDQPSIHNKLTAMEKGNGETKPPIAVITIKARLFFVRIDLKTSPLYSISRTVAVQPVRDTQTGHFRLYYIYENETKRPKDTDCPYHFGAAYLDVVREDSGAQRLEVLYWTNRMWWKGQNTAGRIILSRPNIDVQSTETGDLIAS